MKGILFLLLLPFIGVAQTIINAERLGNDGKDSLVFSCSGSYAGTRGNARTDQVALSSSVMVRKKKNEIKFFASYDLLAQKSNSILNSGFIHGRHQHLLRSRIKSVLFYQLQFNEILRLTKREVMGGGIRIEVLKQDSLSAALTVGLMHEYEVLDRNDLSQGENFKTNYVRGSLVGSFRWFINDFMELSDVVYYQPYLKNMEDFRVLNDVNLVFKLNKNFSILLISTLRFDSRPPSSVQGYDFNFRVGLNYLKSK